MIKHSARFAAGSTDSTPTPGPQLDELVGAFQLPHSGGDVPPANGDSNNSGHSIDNADHFAGIAGSFVFGDSATASVDNAGHSVIQFSEDFVAAFGGNAGHSPIQFSDDPVSALSDNADHSVIQLSDDSVNSLSDGAEHSATDASDDPANIAGDVDSIDQQHLASAASFADLPGTKQVAGFGDRLNDDHLSGLFDHADNLAGGLTNSAAGGSSSTPAGHSFDSPETYPVDPPAAVSEANGHGGGGGGSGGGTAPAPYTTNSGTGVNIHVTYDSSVANAPAGFSSVVQQVADFFASSFQDSTPITLNIDVGYGEVDGMRLGLGAIGESVTNLQQVSYSQLTAAYSASGLGLSLGGSVPAGNLYVSYAEAQALNITITNPQTVDGFVGFSSKNGIFDYNNSDGVSSNQYDFYGAVAHEFSEVMGRILLVGGSINNAPSYMAYDFFHFSSPGVQDFSGNGGYFSNDQGTTNLAYFNNPTNGGDPGDWASTGTSNSGGSVTDAFNAIGTPGHVTPVSHTDLLALQAAGFHLDLVA